MAHWYKILNRTSSSLEVMLYDEIGGWGIPVSDFVGELKRAEGNKITVRINSPGGDMFGGIAIFNYLRALSEKGKEIVTIVDGLAASAASIVFMGGDQRAMNTGTAIMVHDPLWVSYGNAGEMRKAADILDQCAALLVDSYHEATGMDKEELKEMMAKETWLDADEALVKGFATEVSKAKAIAASAAFKTCHYALPKGFQVDTLPKGVATQHQLRKNNIMIKDLHAKFGDKPALLAKATKLAAGDENLTLDQIVDQVEKEHATETIDALTQAKTDLETKVTALTAERDHLKAKLEAKDGNGAPPVNNGEPAGTEKPEPNTPEAVLGEYEAMDAGPERDKFYSQHKATLHKAVGMK